MKIPVFAIIIIVYLVANYYVFQRLWTVIPPNLIIRTIIIVVALITTFGLLVTALVGEQLPIPVTSILYTIGSSWVFIILYFILFFVFQDLLLLINKGLHIFPAKVVTQFSKDNWMGLLFTISFITLLMVGGYMRYNWKSRIELPIELSKVIGDSISPRSIKAVAVSDLHLGYTIGHNELTKWVELINKEKPDVIFIAGDLIDNSLRPVLDQDLAKVLRGLEAPMGVYACLGNHEYIANVDAKQRINFFEDAGIHLLRDDFAEVDSTFYVVGRDDRTNSKRKPLSELVSTLDKTKPIILLDHQPYDLHQAEENGVDLQISGHTHKGQVWPISLITKALYEIDYGYLQKGDSHIYVSSGLGIWGGKFRIGTHSEFVVIDINSKNNESIF